MRKANSQDYPDRGPLVEVVVAGWAAHSKFCWVEYVPGWVFHYAPPREVPNVAGFCFFSPSEGVSILDNSVGTQNRFSISEIFPFRFGQGRFGLNEKPSLQRSFWVHDSPVLRSFRVGTIDFIVREKWEFWFGRFLSGLRRDDLQAESPFLTLTGVFP